MSNRNQSEIAGRFGSNGSQKLRRAVVASTSLLAMSAAMGWSNPALATGTCGAPNGSGVVNCHHKNYPGGIEYNGPDGIPDLTVNVGSFAGQNHAVTVTGGININYYADINNTQSVYIGKNVTVTNTDTGVYVKASTDHRKSTATIYNAGTVTSTGTSNDDRGLDAYSFTYNHAGSAFSTSNVTNSGAITSYGLDVDAFSKSSAYSFDTAIKSEATSTVVNSGDALEMGSHDSSVVYAGAGSYAYSKFNNATSISTASLTNTGKVTSAGTYNDAAVYAVARARADVGGEFKYDATAGAYTTLVNKAAVTTGNGTDAIYGGASALAGRYSAEAPKYASATAVAKISNTGKLVTGTYGVGIVGEAYAYAKGFDGATATSALKISNSGESAVTGDDTNALYGLSEATAFGDFKYATATAVEKLSNSAKLSTAGADSSAIAGYSYAKALSEEGPATATAVTRIKNSGDITTSGNDSDGVYGSAIAIAESEEGTAYAGAYSIVKNSGNITTTGIDSYGVLSVAKTKYESEGKTAAGYYATAKAVASATNSGNVTTYASGVGAYANGAAYGGDGARGVAVANARNSGTVKTSGTEGGGVIASALGAGFSNYEGAFATGAAYATASNSGKVITKGAVAPGVEASALAVSEGFYAYTYAVSAANNSGTIKTRGISSPIGSHGPNSFGLVAISQADSGDAEFASSYASATGINSGTIKVQGQYSVGMYVLAGNEAEEAELVQPYANATAVNSGSISTKGNLGLGIAAISHAYAGGEYAYSAARTNVTNTGSVTTKGALAVGIYGYAYSQSGEGSDIDGTAHNYASASVTNGGSVTTSGDGAVGIAVKSHAFGYGYFEANATAKSSVISTGSVTTAGIEAMGLVAQTYSQALAVNSSYYARANGTASVTNGGSVTVTGLGASGVIAESQNIAVAEGGGKAIAKSKSLVTNTGTISAAHGYGIEAYSLAAVEGAGKTSVSATTTVNNSGDVFATGHLDDGVFAVAVGVVNGVVGSGVATVYNSGDIMATGKGGIGVKVEAAQAYVTTTGGVIEGGRGPKGVGVYASGGAAIVTNGGTIGALDNHAVDLHGLYYAVLTNTGTVVGFATIATSGPTSVALPGATAFLNYGTWVAQGGNTVLSHAANGPASNLVNEVGGKIEVVGSQSFTADTFTNLGLVSLQSPGFETLTVSGDYTGVGGQVAVDANTGLNKADVFSIKGKASGQTGVDVDIVGTPTAISGTSLIVAKTTHGAAAGEFTLIGNTPAHTEVAGAFEYNLAFKAGPGTSGDWYLTSQVWPGASQFAQIGSSTMLVADQININLTDLMGQTGNAVQQSASLDAPVQVAAADNSFVPQPNGGGVSGWGRYNEARFNVDPSGSAFSDYKLRVDTAQFGIDEGWHSGSNTIVLGGLVAPFEAWADFEDFGTHIGMRGTAYSLYGLWFSGPWQAGVKFDYDDVTAHYTDTYIGTNATVKPDEKGVQVAASYLMPMDDWTLEPSAELNYGTSKAVQLTDGTGDLVKVGATNDFWGMLNARFSTDVETAHGLLVQPYANVGLVYRGDSATSVNIDTFSSSTNVNGWDGKFGVGVNTNLAAGLSLSAEADYLAGNRVNGWTGFMSLRYTP